MPQGLQGHLTVVDGVIVRPEWALVFQMFHALVCEVVVTADILPAYVAQGSAVAACDFVIPILLDVRPLALVTGPDHRLS